LHILPAQGGVEFVRSLAGRSNTVDILEQQAIGISRQHVIKLTGVYMTPSHVHCIWNVFRGASERIATVAAIHHDDRSWRDCMCLNS
jgi:hypothetical protein